MLRCSNPEISVQFTSEHAEDIRIEAAATDSSQGGFHACVYLRDTAADGLLWFEEGLSGGRVFVSAEEALTSALKAGRLRARKLLDDRRGVVSR